MDKPLMLVNCHRLLGAMVGDLASEWWSSPNVAFDMQTPQDVWQTDAERVYNYLIEYSLK